MLLLIVIFLTVLTACQNDNADSPDTPEANGENQTAGESSTEPQNYLETLPIEDFGGYTFKIIAQHLDLRPNFPSEEETGEPMNDALLRRNQQIEQRFNITIQNIPFEDRRDVRDRVNNSVRAQDNAYDLIITSKAEGINTLAPTGMLYDLNSLGYLQLTENWWCKSMYETMQVNGKIFYSTGPLSPFYYYSPMVCVFNKTLAADLDIGNIYQLVLNNEWTADKFAELIRNKNRDLDGDGVITNKDFFGLATGDGNCGLAMFNAFEQKVTVRIDESNFRLTLTDEATVNMIDRISEILMDPTSTNNGAFQYEPGSEVPIFVEGRALFTLITMNNVIAHFRSMQDDYGIVPLPKLNSLQSEYISYGNPWGPSGIAVPVYCDNPQRTGLIMETMAYLSYEMVRPAIYDTVIQNKIARDDESQQMLDIIYSNFYFDLNVIHNFGGSSILLRDSLSGFRTDFVSGYEAIKDLAEDDLKTLIDAYLKLD
jgi:hypothetical protein